MPVTETGSPGRWRRRPYRAIVGEPRGRSSSERRTRTASDRGLSRPDEAILVLPVVLPELVPVANDAFDETTVIVEWPDVLEGVLRHL